MLQAILSDIHSNLEALQACVAHAREQGATHFACLGDCVGYGADPVPTLDLLRSLPHLLMIRGNHDEALFQDDVIDVPGIRQVLDWTCTQLAPPCTATCSNTPRLCARSVRLPTHTPAPTNRKPGLTCVSRNRSAIVWRLQMRASHLSVMCTCRWCFT